MSADDDEESWAKLNDEYKMAYLSVSPDLEFYIFYSVA